MIGAGIVGCAAAHYLTLAGVRDVVVVDQGPIGDTGGSSFHAPGLCFQTNGSKLSCTLAQWTRELYRSLDTPERRTWWEVGSLEVATTPERLAELRRRHAYATSWGLESHVITPGRGGQAHPAARPRAPARRAARAERRHRQGRQHLPGAAGGRRGARRHVHRPHARDRHRHGRRPRARGRDRSGRDPHLDGARLPGPLGAGVHARARPAAGRDAADAAPLRVDRSAAGAGRRERSRSSTRSCATRIAPCTSASAARATASAPTGTRRSRSSRTSSSGTPTATRSRRGRSPQEHWPESLGLGARAAAAARRGRHRRDVQRALLVRGRQQLVRRPDDAGRRALAGRRHLGHARAAAPPRPSSTS